MQEIWKDIPGFNGRYQVSDCGNIKSMPRWVKNQSSGFYRKEQVLKQRSKPEGHLYVEITKDAQSNRKKVYIHRAVMYAFNRISDKVIHHKDWNPQNNHISNLEYMTRLDHIQEHKSEDSNIYYNKSTNKYIVRFDFKKTTISKEVETKEEARKIKAYVLKNGVESLKDFFVKPKCVSYYKRSNNYVLKIKGQHIGYFKTEAEAIKERDSILNST